MNVGDRVEVLYRNGSEYIVYEVEEFTSCGFKGQYSDKGFEATRYGTFEWKLVKELKVLPQLVKFENGDHLFIKANSDVDVLFHDDKLWEVAKGLDVSIAKQQVQDGIVKIVRNGKEVEFE